MRGLDAYLTREPEEWGIRDPHNPFEAIEDADEGWGVVDTRVGDPWETFEPVGGKQDADDEAMRRNLLVTDVHCVDGSGLCVVCFDLVFDRLDGMVARVVPVERPLALVSADDRRRRAAQQRYKIECEYLPLDEWEENREDVERLER